MTNYERHLDEMSRRNWERIAERLESAQKAFGKTLETITALQKSNEHSENPKDNQAQTHKHFSELHIAGRIDGMVRCKEFVRFCVAVKTDLNPLDNATRNNYFCIYLEGKMKEDFLNRVCIGDYVYLWAKIRAYLGWGEPFGNPMNAWSSPVQLYIDDPAQIIQHEICSKNDKDEIATGITFKEEN